MTRYVITGSLFPFSVIGSRFSNSKRCIASRRVVSLTSTWPSGAADSSRCAVFTASPTTVYARCTSPASRPATTSPVFTPMRRDRRTPYLRSRSSLSRMIDACIASAARIARSASSSCEIGAPNTAITASPMYLSIVPSYRWICRASAPKYEPRIPRSSSGSSFSASGVEPERSAKRIVTTLRCSRSASAVSAATWRDALEVGAAAAAGAGAWAAAIGVPQLGQKRSFARIVDPQFAQVALVRAGRSGMR